MQCTHIPSLYNVSDNSQAPFQVLLATSVSYESCCHQSFVDLDPFTLMSPAAPLLKPALHTSNPLPFFPLAPPWKPTRHPHSGNLKSQKNQLPVDQ